MSSKAVYSAKVAGYESDVRSNFQKYSKGEITRAEYLERKDALEQRHIAWLKKYEKEGVTAKEQKELERAIASQQAKKYKAEAVEIYQQRLRGEITRKQMRQRLKKLEREHIPRVERILRGAPTKEEYEGIEYRTKFEKVTETETKTETFERQYSRVLGWDLTSQLPRTVGTGARVPFVGPPTREEMGILDPPRVWKHPGPVGGPRPGSIGAEISARLTPYYERYEKAFTTIEAQPGTYARSLREKALTQWKEGDKLTALSLGVEAHLMRATKGIVTGLTFAIRPGLVAESVAGMAQLVSSQEARARAVSKFVADPTGALAEIGGQFVGGYTAGEIIKGDPTIDITKTGSYQLRTARSLKQKTYGSSKVMTKQAVKIVQGRAGEWAGAQLLTGKGKWPKGKTGAYAWAGDGLVPVLVPDSVPTTPGFELILKPRPWTGSLYRPTGLIPRVSVKITPSTTPLRLGISALGARLHPSAEDVAQERVQRISTKDAQALTQMTRQQTATRTVTITQLVTDVRHVPYQDISLRQELRLDLEQKQIQEQRRRGVVIPREMPLILDIPSPTIPTQRRPPYIRQPRRQIEFPLEPRRKRKKLIPRKQPSLVGELRVYPIRSPLNLLGINNKRKGRGRK